MKQVTAGSYHFLPLINNLLLLIKMYYFIPVIYQKENLVTAKLSFHEMVVVTIFFKVFKITEEVLWDQNQMRHLCD